MYSLYYLNNFISLVHGIAMAFCENKSVFMFNFTKNFHMNSKIFLYNLQYH